MKGDKMEYPMAELLDRYVIAALKAERIPGNQDVIDDYVLYQEQIMGQEFAVAFFGIVLKYMPEIAGLEIVHKAIWDLEADIRQGKEGALGLEEVGCRALEIRDLNAKRIAIKNRIAEKAGGSKEVKYDHASQEVGVL